MLDPTDLLTDTQVGLLLKKGPSAVRKLRAKGELAFLPGRPPLTPREAVLAYLERRIAPKSRIAIRGRIARR